MREIDESKAELLKTKLSPLAGPHPLRKEVPFEPDKTPVPTDLYIAGGRAVGADRAESERGSGGRAGCRGAGLVRIRLDACLD